MHVSRREIGFNFPSANLLLSAAVLAVCKHVTRRARPVQLLLQEASRDLLCAAAVAGVVRSEQQQQQEQQQNKSFIQTHLGNTYNQQITVTTHSPV